VHFLILGQSLVGVENRTQTILDTEDVIVDGVQVRHGVRARDVSVVQTQNTAWQGRGHDDTEGVKTAEVQGARGLELGGVQAIADDSHVGRAVVMHIAVGCVVILGHVAEVDKGPRVPDVHTVHLGLELVVGGGQRAHTVGVDLGVIDTREGQELDGLSQGQLLHWVVAEHNTLDLGDEHIIGGCLGEIVALSLVQVHEVGPGLELKGAVCGGSLSRAGEERDGQTGRHWGGNLGREVHCHCARAHVRHVDRAGERQTSHVLADLDTTLAQRAHNLADGQNVRGHSRRTRGLQERNLGRTHWRVQVGRLAQTELGRDVARGAVGKSNDNVGEIALARHWGKGVREGLNDCHVGLQVARGGNDHHTWEERAGRLSHQNVRHVRGQGHIGCQVGRPLGLGREHWVGRVADGDVLAQIGRPGDADLHIVELQTNKGQTHGPVLAEEKLQRQERVLLVIEGGTVVVQVPLGVVLGAGDGLDVGHVLDILGVHNLAADEELDLVDNLGPVWVHQLGSVRVTDGQVHVAQQVSLLLEADGRDATGDGGTLNHLALHRVGVVRVALVVGPVKGNLGLAGQPSVLRADGDELNNTSRHLVLTHIFLPCLSSQKPC